MSIIVNALNYVERAKNELYSHTNWIPEDDFNANTIIHDVCIGSSICPAWS